MKYKNCGRWLVFSLQLIWKAASAQGTSPESPPPLPEFRVETACVWQQEIRRINTWFERDQSATMRIWRLHQQHPDGIPRTEYEPVKKDVDAEKAALQDELEDLVQRCGWPSRTAFGERAGESAFLIVQHAPAAFQARYLPLVQAAAMAGELPRRMWASLFDRVQVAQGRPQRFGSQICSDGPARWKVCDIETVEGIDARRASADMVPVSWCAYLGEMDVQHPSCASGAAPAQSSIRP